MPTEGEDAAALVRRFYDAWNRKGPRVLERFASAGVVLRDAKELPDAGVWRGRAEVRSRLEEVAEHVGGGWVELTEVRPFGRRVLVAMEWKLDDLRQGAEVGRVFHLVEVESGEVASLTESEALAAATG
jgi:hypothetical protein